MSALALLLCAACASPNRAGTTGEVASLALSNVNIVDVQSGRILPEQTVLILESRIRAVGPLARGQLPPGTQVVDASGKYLIPGLWDMHAHLAAAASDRLRIPLYLANGITGVRSMGPECVGECRGSPVNLDSIRSWRADAARGGRLLPRIVAGGPTLDGPNPARPVAWKAATAEEGAAGVRYTRTRSGDFVKVYSLLPREAFFGALREARRLGLPVVGHVPAAVLPTEASDSGMVSMEHNMGLWEECSSRAGEWKLRLDSLAAMGGGAGFARVSAFVTPEVMDSYDPARCRTVLLRLARNGTWLVPTLVLRRGFAAQLDSAAASDPRLRYVPTVQQAGWAPSTDFRTSSLGPAAAAARRERLRREPWLVANAHAAGVRILAGSDSGNPFVFPGFSLHEELELLVAGGLTPLEALRTATWNPAVFLAATDSLGTVESGKVADLVLLDANPLEDIRNTQRIRAVVLNGRYLDRKTLDELLANAERAASGR